MYKADSKEEIMDKKKQEWELFLEKSKAETREKIDELVKDDRADEARFLRASYNIYDIFKSLFDASYLKANGDAEVLKESFMRLAENVPASWKKSLEAAMENDDVEKILMEEAKLNTASIIVDKFDELFTK